MILSISWTIAQVQYSQTFLHHAGSPPLLNFFLSLFVTLSTNSFVFVIMG